VSNNSANTAAFPAQILAACVLLLANMSIYGATVINTSVLPVSEYTRITVETDQSIAHSVVVLKNPDRVVLDLKSTPINQPLKALANKVLPNDFYIKKIRVANFKQGVTRIVVDLKAEAKPKLTVYKPVGGYQYRLALDIYPQEKAKSSAESIVDQEVDTVEADTGNLSSNGAGIVLEPNPVFEPEVGVPGDIE
jgi:N-acetylmuramoyl-L-alanine amidase